VQFGPRRDEKQREALRPVGLFRGAEIDAELDPVGIDERKGPLIGQEVDVEIILTDRRQRKTVLTPGQIGFAKFDSPR